MKPIYVEDEIYNFFSTQRENYGSFNNVVKAVLRKLAALQEEKEILQDVIGDNDSFIKEVLLESVRHPQQLSSYSGGVNNKTLQVAANITPNKVPSKKGLGRDLQLVFNAMEGDSVKPSDFLKMQNELEEKPIEKKLNPPPLPPKAIVLEMPVQDES